MKAEPTPGPYAVYETTVYAASMLGVAACGPDPFCREHYRGGLGGHFFAPPEDPAVQQANARAIALALNGFKILLAFVRTYAESCPECDGARVLHPANQVCAACGNIWAIIDQVETLP